MKRIIAVIGRPGTGKSTLIRHFMEPGSLAPSPEDWPLEKFGLLQYHHAGFARGEYVLGNYADPAETFPGTDRLSMAVAPEALRWMLGQWDGRSILFEGDRLGNASTLRTLSLDPGILLRIIHLSVPDHELERRYMLRGSAQSRRVLASRATKVANICANPNLHPLVRSRFHRTPEQTAELVREMRLFFLGGKL